MKHLEAPGDRETARLRAILRCPAQEAAPALIGRVLVRRLGDELRAVRIVEVEAYLGRSDPAAHAFRGRTPRTEPLFGPPGTLYVYFVYGMHHCLNLSVDRTGRPGCVLIRAAEPLPGTGLGPESCRGPGRLCRSLAIDRTLSGRHLFEENAVLTLRMGKDPDRLAVSPRIGIRRAADQPLRFFDPESAAVSHHRRRGVTSEFARSVIMSTNRLRRQDP